MASVPGTHVGNGMEFLAFGLHLAQGAFPDAGNRRSKGGGD